LSVFSFVPYYSGPLREVDDLPKTERGEGAFGSTGQQ